MALLEKVEADVEELKRRVKNLTDIATSNTEAIGRILECVRDLRAVGDAHTDAVRSLRETIMSLHPELGE